MVIQTKRPHSLSHYIQSLKTLLDALISQSSAAKFSKSESGSPPSAINGLFQCKGDLSGFDCRDCVSRMPALAQKLCGQAIATRVQLEGCYLRYEIPKGVVSSGGYYVGTYQAVSMVDQCEGDLSSADCVSCVKNVIERAKSECESSISAWIYLQECYITYNYYPNDVPTHQQPLSPLGKI